MSFSSLVKYPVDNFLSPSLLWVVLLSAVFAFLFSACPAEDTASSPPVMPPGGFTGVDDMDAYLKTQTGGTALTDPVEVKVSIDLGNEWQNLLATLNTAGKYVDLDLSGSTMNGREFNPDPAVTAGKDTIISVVLPASAASIIGWDYNSDLPFNGFTNLKTVSGENVAVIGVAALAACPGLISASFPKATAINDVAFAACPALTSVSFSAAASISGNPFMDCPALSSFILIGSGSLSTLENGKALVKDHRELIAYPAVSGTITMNPITSIGDYAFWGCTGLTGANFPAATVIGREAFRGCTGLTSLSLPAVHTLGAFVFAGTGNADLTITLGASAPTVGVIPFIYVETVKTVTVRVPTGASGYDDAWKAAFKRDNAHITLNIEEYGQ